MKLVLVRYLFAAGKKWFVFMVDLIDVSQVFKVGRKKSQISSNF